MRLLRRLRGNRAAVILHHLVNGYGGDILTTDLDSFAAQLLALTPRYPRLSTSQLVEALEKRRKIPATSVVIHFDDCYRDVYANAAPILTAAGFSATAFVSSGFVESDRQFPHDQGKYPFHFENLSSAEIRAWVAHGFEVGAHTVNHADLGACTVQQAEYEVRESGRTLQTIVGEPIRWFSFPFGAIHNIRQKTAEVVMQTGFSAMFSAHGGFVRGKTPLSDIPRLGCNGLRKNAVLEIL